VSLYRDNLPVASENLVSYSSPELAANSLEVVAAPASGCGNAKTVLDVLDSTKSRVGAVMLLLSCPGVRVRLLGRYFGTDLQNVKVRREG
jgi:hypothetical protein